MKQREIKNTSASFVLNLCSINFNNIMKHVFVFFVIILDSFWVYGQKETEYSLNKKLDLLKQHNHAFITMGDTIRDPFITCGPDGNYYLTGTTADSNWGDTIGVKVWKSTILCDWKSLGFVWQLYKDGKNGWFFNRPSHKIGAKNPYAVWAPELHFMNDTWWITVSRNGGGNGLLKSITGTINGPYEGTNIHYNEGIDSHLFCDGENHYYAFGSNKIGLMDNKIDSICKNQFVDLKVPGKHPMGYEGIFLIKYADKFLWIASGRYGYEPTNTYDLYYSVSDSLMQGYAPRRMMIKNAGHGSIVCDKNGNWWCTAFDHEYTEHWCCWLVPINIKEVSGDIIIEVLDERFRPTDLDQEVVRRLSKTGIPKEWKGKKFWWRPQ